MQKQWNVYDTIALTIAFIGVVSIGGYHILFQ